MSHKITVSIDADLRGIVPRFLELRQEDIVSINEAMAECDYETIRRLGHSMKGSGAGYGFDYVTEIGKNIEIAAKKDDNREIKKWIDELSSYLDNVEIIYE